MKSTLERVHVDRQMCDRLRSVEQHRHPGTVRGGDPLLDRCDDAGHVRHVRNGHEPRPRRETGRELRPNRHGLRVEIDEPRLGRHTPRHVVRMVLRRGQHHLVAARESERAREQIERVRRVVREHDLRRLGADQRRDAMPRTFERFGRRLGQRMHAPVHVRAERLVVSLDGRNHGTRLRRRGGAVEVDEGRAVVAALEQRETRAAHQRFTNRYFPEASGSDRGHALAANRSREQLADRAGRKRGAVVRVPVHHEQHVACELPLLERRIGTERRMDRVVERERRDGLARHLDAIGEPPLDSIEQRPVAGQAALACGRFRDAHDVADVVAQQRHPRPAERRHEHAREPARARQRHEVDVAVALVRVQLAALALHEQHAGLGRAVELEQRRVDRAADVALHRASGGLVGERHVFGRRRPHAGAQRGARNDREICGVGFDAERREVAPLLEHAAAIPLGPMRGIGALVQEQHAVDLAFLGRQAADVARAAAAGRRREHGLAVLGLLERPRDASHSGASPRALEDSTRTIPRSPASDPRSCRKSRAGSLGRRASRRAGPGRVARATRENPCEARACRRPATARATAGTQLRSAAEPAGRGTAAPRPPSAAFPPPRAPSAPSSSSLRRSSPSPRSRRGRRASRRTRRTGSPHARIVPSPSTTSAAPLGTAYARAFSPSSRARTAANDRVSRHASPSPCVSSEHGAMPRHS